VKQLVHPAEPITRDKIRRLATLDSRGACILSVYLGLAPERQVEGTYRTVFKNLAKELRGRLDEARRAALDVEIARVEDWLTSDLPRGTGVAAFASKPAGVWDTLHLHVPIRDRLVFEATAYVAPVVDVLDEYERYVVALVDKEKARFFSVFLGEIEDSDDFRDFVPGKHDQGGVSQANVQRHHEAHVFRHLKRVAEYLTDVYARRSFDWLVLAGPDEATTEVRSLLPRAIASRVVATIPAETFASSQEILERTLEIERQVERATEERILSELFDIAATGGLATVGVDSTLEALFFGEVRTLVVADGAQAEGSECANCARLATPPLMECPACDQPMHLVMDVFEKAIEQTLAMDGSVEVVHGDPAQRLLTAAGGLGALLRYEHR
jgi:peptide chain release factor subunit 1